VQKELSVQGGLSSNRTRPRNKAVGREYNKSINTRWGGAFTNSYSWSSGSRFT